MNNPMMLAAMPQERALDATIPPHMLESLIQEHLADPTATLIASMVSPFPHQGTNDSSTLFQVVLTWISPGCPQTAQATWIVKRWQAGGQRDQTLGIQQPREVLAWEQGWLHPTALPTGIDVPFVGARRSPDGTEAWLAMTDVSTELAAYVRLSLTGEQTIQRAHTILARLARFHALWEQPVRQAELQASPWHWRPEVDLWAMTPAREPGADDDLEAFLAARPLAERRLWERLLINRRAVVDDLIDAPHTLIHNDLDDRNLGLRWSDRDAEADLVLIDWEWLTMGPAVIDVSKIVQMLPVMIQPGAPIPAAVWSDDFAQTYFAHYRAAGGRRTDAESWRYTYGLAIIAQGLAQTPWIHGRLRRTIRGELPPPQLVGIPEAVLRQQLRAGLPMMEQMEARIVHEAKRWLG
jgi:thiamine kinase-like enzyme